MKRKHSFRMILMAVMAIAVMAVSPCADSYAAKQKKTTQSQQKNTRNKSAKSSKKSSSKTNSVKSGKPKNTSRKPGNGKSAKPRKGTNTSPKSSAEAKRLQEAAQREIQQTKEKIRLNEQEIKENLADLNQLSSEIKTGRTRVSNLRDKVSRLDSEINTLSANIAGNEKELARMRDEYLKAVKKMRLNRKNRSMLAFIFASDDFNQALRRFRYMRQFSKWKERKNEEIIAMVDTLERERRQLAHSKDVQTASLSQLAKTQADLETKHSRQQQLVAGLKQNGAALQTHLAQKQNEANQLKNAIASLIAQEQAKAEAERKAREKAEAERIAREKAEAERIAREKAEAERQQSAEKAKEENKKSSDAKKEADRKKKAEEKKRKEEEKQRAKERKARKKDRSKSKTPAPGVESPNPKETKPAAPVEGGDFAALRGKLPKPVDGNWRVTNPFGRHAMPELPEVVYDNPGIDAEVAQGATVKAVAPGKVSGVYKLDGYGTVVIVNHGEYYTVYGNLSSVNVSVGTPLSSGSHIGNAAADPDDRRRGSVHFELWKGREKLNPESWLR